MDATAWLWAGALSGVAWALGYAFGRNQTIKFFARMLIEFGLWRAYAAASEEWERKNS